MIEGLDQYREETWHWLPGYDNAETKERIWNLGLLTGWRLKRNDKFGPANFERALVLDRLVEQFCPASVLEIGTGRGLGCLSMAAAAQRCGLSATVTTVDILAPDRPIKWPIRIDDEDSIIRTSRDEVWSRWISRDLHENVHQLTGRTDVVLPRLLSEKRSFDLVFIDGPHDPFSVMHDLIHSFHLLRQDGIILMDDFAPLDEFGWGTCFSVPHARRWFEHISVFPTDGLVFGNADHPDYPRGMVYLKNKRDVCPRWSLQERLLWRLAATLLRRCWRGGGKKR